MISPVSSSTILRYFPVGSPRNLERSLATWKVRRARASFCEDDEVMGQQSGIGLPIKSSPGGWRFP